MATKPRLGRLAHSLMIFTCFLVGASVSGQQTRGDALPVPATAADAKPTASEAVSEHHPLAWVMAYAQREQRYLKQTVRDYTCRLIKRERINGILQENYFIDMKVREEVRRNGEVEKPFATYLYFWAPKQVAGRKVLF